jgi:glycine oxidase
MGTAPDVVVVGAGITGAFSAYFLARDGVATTLVDRGPVGGRASGSNPGGLNPLHGPGIPGPMQALALESFALHLEHRDAIREASGSDFAWWTTPRIRLAFDGDDLARLAAARRPYDATPGFSAEWLEPGDLAAVEPRLGPGVLRGLRTEGTARVAARAYTQAVARAAVRLGATLVRADVRGVVATAGRLSGLRLDPGEMTCGGAVFATGSWAAAPAEWLGAPLPVEPVRGELVRVRAQGGGLDHDLAWRDVAVYAEGGQELLLGGTAERADFDDAPTAAARESILTRASRILPGINNAPVLDQIAGLRPATPDALPILGRPAGWDNVCVATGAGGKGMLLGAGLGRAAADLATGASTRLSIAPCSLDRPAVAGPAR